MDQHDDKSAISAGEMKPLALSDKLEGRVPTAQKLHLALTVDGLGQGVYCLYVKMIGGLV